MSFRALVLAGDGINCERETAEAFKLAGFAPEIRHLNDVIAEKISLDQLSRDYSVLALPGGFSFGDDLGSGRVLALKIRHGLNWDLSAYAKRGGLVIGICNGFQALIRMGVFGRSISITSNAGGHFIDKWVELESQGQDSLWLKGIKRLRLPMRHGEGRIVAEKSLSQAGCHSALRYLENPNGSLEDCAGLSDSTGRILGLMPHPEAFVKRLTAPDWTSEMSLEARLGPGDGLEFFLNAMRAAKSLAKDSR